jgi:alpha-glucosidase
MSDSEFLATQWWQTGVIYQIYPRSFQDTDGNGVGDLPGITARLDYLVSLGINALWISPFYPSPMADFGYDVANYTNVDPLFGTLADFDALLASAHAKGLRVILDFVPNHSSDQHPWFLESHSSRHNPQTPNPKRDWYLWHDPVPYPNLPPGQDTRPLREQYPNNWMSHFGGPAWTWDETTQQFYLHSFLAQQPDLNWRNPEVREAIYAAMRFWLERGPERRGIDGFRMDVLWLLIKDAEFRNNPPNPDYHGGLHDFASTLPVYTSDQPETHQIVAQMRALLDSYGPTIPDFKPANGAWELETGNSNPKALPAHLPTEPTQPPKSVILSAASSPREEAQPKDPEAAQTPAAARAISTAAAPAHSLTTISNRVLIGEIYLPIAELVRYYGQPAKQGPTVTPAPQTPELNGANLPFNFHLILTAWNAPAIANVIRTYEAALPPGAWPNYVLGNHDQSRLATRIGPQQARAAAMLLLTLRGTPTLYYGDELGMQDVPISPSEVQDPAEKNEPGKGRGRDPERSPMLWVDAPNAGFTTPEAKPWLPLLQDWPAINAATQRGDKRSMLTLYRHLLHLRRQHDTLHSGPITDVAAEGTILRYRRVALPDGVSTDFQILLNLGNDTATTHCAPGTIVLTTLLDGSGSRTGDPDTHAPAPITLEAGEGLLVALD